MNPSELSVCALIKLAEGPLEGVKSTVDAVTSDVGSVGGEAYNPYAYAPGMLNAGKWGLGIGAGAGLLSHLMKPREERKNTPWYKRVLGMGLTGAAIGAGGSGLLTKMKRDSAVSDLAQEDLNSLIGIEPGSVEDQFQLEGKTLAFREKLKQMGKQYDRHTAFWDGNLTADNVVQDSIDGLSPAALRKAILESRQSFYRDNLGDISMARGEDATLDNVRKAFGNLGSEKSQLSFDASDIKPVRADGTPYPTYRGIGPRHPDTQKWAWPENMARLEGGGSDRLLNPNLLRILGLTNRAYGNHYAETK